MLVLRADGGGDDLAASTLCCSCSGSPRCFSQLRFGVSIQPSLSSVLTTLQTRRTFAVKVVNEFCLSWDSERLLWPALGTAPASGPGCLIPAPPFLRAPRGRAGAELLQGPGNRRAPGAATGPGRAGSTAPPGPRVPPVAPYFSFGAPRAGGSLFLCQQWSFPRATRTLPAFLLLLRGFWDPPEPSTRWADGLGRQQDQPPSLCLFWAERERSSPSATVLGSILGTVPPGGPALSGRGRDGFGTPDPHAVPTSHWSPAVVAFGATTDLGSHHGPKFQSTSSSPSPLGCGGPGAEQGRV